MEKYSIKDFFTRRVLKIFPELWICVLFNLGIILISIDEYSVKDILVYLGTQLTVFQFYTGNWLRNYGVGVPNGALWTIAVDIQFYIVSIILAKLLRKRKIVICCMFIIIAAAVDLLLEKGCDYYPSIVYRLLQCNLIPFLWIFLSGMCIYYNKERLIPQIVKIRWLLVGAYLVWQYAIPKTITALFNGIRYNVVATILMLLMVVGIGFSYTKRFKVDYSYSFYLYHMVVINFIINNVCVEFDDVKHFILYLLFSIFVIAIFAVISQKYIAGLLTNAIEKNIKKYKKARGDI